MKNILLLTCLLPLFAISQIKVGDHAQGGIVYRVDKSGKHGLVMTDHNVRDLCTYDSAIAICKAMGWRMPDGSDWYGDGDNGIYYVTIVKHYLKLPSLYYWCYSSGASSTNAPARYSTTDDGAIGFNRKTGRIAFIAVRKF